MEGYTDLTPLMRRQHWLGEIDECWTIALKSNDSVRETHFGLFADPDDALAARDSGMVTTMPGQWLELRRIRTFPTN